MARRPPKRTCESCLDIDVREWQREGLLRYGATFSCSWSRFGKPPAKVDVASRGDAVVLRFHARGAEQEQGLRLTWSRVTYGLRPWFRCGCGRRCAKLYLGSGHTAFGCRTCYALGYTSQNRPAAAAITRAQKLQMQLGGGPSLSDPLPDRPPRMHRSTYFRLFAAAIKAQERALGLEINEIRRRFPGLLTQENGFPPMQDAVAPSKRSGRFFSARSARAFAAWNDRGRPRQPHGPLVQAERPLGG
jgi:hypothetical protein